MASNQKQLKRVFSGITISTNDLKSVAHHAAGLGGQVAMKANSYRLEDIEQIRDVIAEDVVIDHLSISAHHEHAPLEFTYEPGYILVQAEEDHPALRTPFAAIVALLESKPRNGFNACALDLSAPGTWVAPDHPETVVDPAPAVRRDSAQHDAASPRGGLLSRWWHRLSHSSAASKK